jgi:hypothetical protein
MVVVVVEARLSLLLHVVVGVPAVYFLCSDPRAHRRDCAEEVEAAEYEAAAEEALSTSMSIASRLVESPKLHQETRNVPCSKKKEVEAEEAVVEKTQCWQAAWISQYCYQYSQTLSKRLQWRKQPRREPTNAAVSCLAKNEQPTAGCLVCLKLATGVYCMTRTRACDAAFSFIVNNNNNNTN